ncbi:MAG TPA: hypothetical protein DEF80_05760 [Pantoea sp.]|nr:hypothetical protein [Pantoea sp.]
MRLNVVSAHRHCVAHILLSRTFKSNNFSETLFDCANHTQLGQNGDKKSELSTMKGDVVNETGKRKQKRKSRIFNKAVAPRTCARR